MPETSEQYQRIRATVLAVRSKVVTRLAFEAAVSVLAGCTTGLAAGVFVFSLAEPSPSARALVFGLWLVALAGLCWWRLVRPVRAYAGLGRVARLIESRFPSIRTDITASLQFGAELEELRQAQTVSVERVERLLAQTGAKRDRMRP